MVRGRARPAAGLLYTSSTSIEAGDNPKGLSQIGRQRDQIVIMDTLINQVGPVHAFVVVNRNDRYKEGLASS